MDSRYIRLGYDTGDESDGTVLFSTDWESATYYGAGVPNVWWGIERVAEDRFARQQTYVRHGSWAIKVEVQPGDYIDGERSEVTVPQDDDGVVIWTTENNGTEYIAFSTYFPSDYVTLDADHWLIFCQLHGAGALPPALDFEVYVEDGTDHIYIRMSQGNQDTPSEVYYPLSENGINKGYWIDWVLKIKYAITTTGSIDVYRRDEGDSSFTNVCSHDNIATLQYSTGEENPEDREHYWKHGVYRAVTAGKTSIIYIDGFTIASTFDAAVNNAFGV